MQGLEFYLLQRKGKCKECQSELPVGTKTVVLGSYNNEYRYCLDCFSFEIGENCDISLDGMALILE